MVSYITCNVLFFFFTFKFLYHLEFFLLSGVVGSNIIFPWPFSCPKAFNCIICLFSINLRCYSLSCIKLITYKIPYALKSYLWTFYSFSLTALTSHVLAPPVFNHFIIGFHSYIGKNLVIILFQDFLDSFACLFFLPHVRINVFSYTSSHSIGFV